MSKAEPEPRRIVLVLKKTPYQIYFLERKSRLYLNHRAGEDDVRRMKQAHAEHLRTVEVVEREMRRAGLPWRAVQRADRFQCRPDEMVITIGGDGTFLEASHHIQSQWILGINSDPARSIGYYCSADRNSFRDVLTSVLSGKCHIRSLNRLALTQNGKRLDVAVLNEILIAHAIPAAMSRYRLRIGNVTEEQRSSGIWISTAVGSTAAIGSAGGRAMSEKSQSIQYLPRELFEPPGRKHVHRGGVLPAGTRLEVTSLMRDGRFYVDGSHLRIPFVYGDRLVVRNSRYPLQVVR